VNYISVLSGLKRGIQVFGKAIPGRWDSGQDANKGWGRGLLFDRDGTTTVVHLERNG
jgi:hypothetical protein